MLFGGGGGAVVNKGGTAVRSAFRTVLSPQRRRLTMARCDSFSISYRRRISAHRETFMVRSWNETEARNRPVCGTVGRGGSVRHRVVGSVIAARRAPASTACGRPPSLRGPIRPAHRPRNLH